MNVSIAHPTDRPNFSVVHFGPLTLWFSYETVIAFRDGWGDTVIRQNDWGPTTGKHLNYVDTDPCNRIPGPLFEERLQAVLGRLDIDKMPV